MRGSISAVSMPPPPHPLRKAHHGNFFYMIMTFQSPLPGIQKGTISHPGSLNKKWSFDIYFGLANCILIKSVFSFDLVETCIWRSVSLSLNVALESAAHFWGPISSRQTLVLLTLLKPKHFDGWYFSGNQERMKEESESPRTWASSDENYLKSIFGLCHTAWLF